MIVGSHQPVGRQSFIGAPVGRHTLATGSHHSVTGIQSAWLTAGEITVTNASGAKPAAATDAMRRTRVLMRLILPGVGPLKPRRKRRRWRTDFCDRACHVRPFTTLMQISPVCRVREGGLEPPRPKTRAPKARASANFATRA
jgi:hypothetical protein